MKMELVLLACALFLAFFCRIQGSSAVTPVFVQKGEDVLLNARIADDFEEDAIVIWNFATNDVVLVRFIPEKEPIIPPLYTGRIEFSVKNYSLNLKNLQEADEGVYTAQVVGKRTVLTKYNISIQDPVSPVNLTVSKTSDSCNLSVTCRTLDSHINSTFRCDAKTCSGEGGERSEVSTSGASLRVYLVNDLIFCNHSNQVSWTKDSATIERFCPGRADKQVNNITVPVTVASITFIVIIIAGAVFVVQREKNKREKAEYEVTQRRATSQPVESQTNDPSGLSPTSTYCLVGPHSGSVGSTKSSGYAQPESLYAQVEKPARS
ncbi:SLAM family member 9-like [Chelmon rostratus]|uniref:SLAM family member 9-like n=1 Tax=Chelmon rostratus TaxID=109905 RepID=UPI001BE568F7|nr:SLAM family member 9-like [Chelmon rostratus]